MPLKLSAFPKCYIDRIAGERSMTVFEWIEMARQLDADGLEMYDGFFTSLDDGYIDRIGDAIRAADFAMPMLCCSPDFTHPDPDERKREHRLAAFQAEDRERFARIDATVHYHAVQIRDFLTAVRVALPQSPATTAERSMS